MIPLALVLSGCAYKNVTLSAGDCFLRAEGTEVDIDLSDIIPVVSPLTPEGFTQAAEPGLLIHYKNEQCEVKLSR